MKTILLVDDVKFFLELEQTFLRRTNCRTIIASNGREAIKIAAQEKPDLILMDLFMPKMSGDEACKHIKEDPELKHIPIIMVTMAGKEEEKSRCLLAGCDDYITKPIHRMNLLDKIRSHVDVAVRKHVRAPLETDTSYIVGDNPFTGKIVDISEGGIFIASEDLHPVGEKLAFNFTIPTAPKITIKGEGEVVRHTTQNMPGPTGKIKGVGVRFIDINPEGLREISHYIKMGNYMV